VQFWIFYLPHAFKRHMFPDGGIVTPRQIAFELVQYARKHPEIHLTVIKIPLVPGNHQTSRVGKSAAESLIVTGYVIPIALLSPIAAGAIVADDLAWGRFPLPLKEAKILEPEKLASLASESGDAQGRYGNEGQTQMAAAQSD
jgi:hypothetical protein